MKVIYIRAKYNIMYTLHFLLRMWEHYRFKFCIYFIIYCIRYKVLLLLLQEQIIP